MSSITVTVKLENGTTVEGVAVTLSTTPVITQSTNSSGITLFGPGLANGTYTLTTPQIGIYEANSTSVVITEDTAVTLILLATETIASLPIDQKSIRRVKTKNMEIETHDPRILQDVRQREQTTPCFCDVDICKAVPKCSPESSSR